MHSDATCRDQCLRTGSTGLSRLKSATGDLLAVAGQFCWPPPGKTLSAIDSTDRHSAHGPGSRACRPKRTQFPA